MINNNFWTTLNSESAALYGLSVFSIPSDIVAYEVVCKILDPVGKTVLDFGCFNGTFANFLSLLEAKRVVGVDIVPEYIQQARDRFKGEEKITFMENKEINSSKFEGCFDVAVMAFVHPTIKSKEELYMALNLISKTLKKGGKLVILGLHKNSISGHGSFLYYQLELLNKGELADESLFKNTIKIPKQKQFTFLDCFWTNETIQKNLENSRMKTISVIPVNQDMENDLKEVFLNSVKKVTQLNPGVRWGDEWKSPLYQIIVAEKY